MNKKALRLMLMVVRRIIQEPSTTYNPDTELVSCDDCGVLAYDAEKELLLDENNHKEYCKWRALKEAYNNLHNPGY
jgi:hypothetical protein